jgi:glutamine amidotransferase
VFTSDSEQIRKADHVILPGVGAAGAAMQKLRERELTQTIRALSQPVLGVCLGMQLLFESTEEGDVELLGIIPARVSRRQAGAQIRVPHMGWNTINTTSNDNVCGKLYEHWFYFVHSFAAPVGEWTLATSEHGKPFSAVVRQRNFYGAQFHPERSASSGARLLTQFLALGRS